MLGADDDHQLVARHRLADENWIIDLSLDKAKIRFAAANRSRRLACVDHRQPDRDARMGATKGGEMTRQRTPPRTALQAVALIVGERGAAALALR